MPRVEEIRRRKGMAKAELSRVRKLCFNRLCKQYGVGSVPSDNEWEDKDAQLSDSRSPKKRMQRQISARH